MANKNNKCIITHTKAYYQKDIKKIKNFLYSLSEDFNINHIESICVIEVNFDIEIPEDTSYVIPNKLNDYKPNKNESLLEILNNMIWLYWSEDINFNENIKYFHTLIDKLKYHNQYEITDEILNNKHKNLLNEIIINMNKTESFQDFIEKFYTDFGFDLTEYLEKVTYNTQEEFHSRELNTTQNKILYNLSNLSQLTTSTREISTQIYSSKPIHKLIKAHSIKIEINPLISQEKSIKLLNNHYKSFTKFVKIFKHFDIDNEFTDINTNMPTSISGFEIIKKALIIFSIMKYYNLKDIAQSIRYYNYFTIKENYTLLHFESDNLITFLDEDTYEHLDGKITFKKNTMNIIQKGRTKVDVTNLVKFFKQYL